MPVLHEDDYARVATNVQDFPCADDVYVDGLYLVKRKTIIRNLPSHRPKPVDLLMNMTSLAQQSTRTTTARISSREQDVVDFSCGVFPYLLGTKITRSVNMQFSEIMHADSPDWVTGIRNNIKGEVTNLSDYMSEFRETAGMFKSFAGQMGAAYNALRGKQNKRRKSIKAGCAAAQTRLMGEYGIKPLANDLFKSLTNLNTKLGLDYVWAPIRNRVTETKYFDTREPNFGGFVGQSTVTSSAKFWVKLRTGYVGDHFTPGNPAEFAWNSIPFSFLVDWSIPIGNYLSSLDALHGVSAIRGSVTTREQYYHSDLTKHTADAVVTTPGRLIVKSHQRTAFDFIPSPPLPTWQPSKSYKRLLNGVALLKGVSQGCKG